MTKFTKGDRVRVYGKFPFTGVITNITSYGIYVHEDGFYSAHNDCPVHEKQCRRLKKKSSQEGKVIVTEYQVAEKEIDKSFLERIEKLEKISIMSKTNYENVWSRIKKLELICEAHAIRIKELEQCQNPVCDNSCMGITEAGEIFIKRSCTLRHQMTRR